MERQRSSRKNKQLHSHAEFMDIARFTKGHDFEPPNCPTPTIRERNPGPYPPSDYPTYSQGSSDYSSQQSHQKSATRADGLPGFNRQGTPAVPGPPATRPSRRTAPPPPPSAPAAYPDSSGTYEYEPESVERVWPENSVQEKPPYANLVSQMKNIRNQRWRRPKGFSIAPPGTNFEDFVFTSDTEQPSTKGWYLSTPPNPVNPPAERLYPSRQMLENGIRWQPPTSPLGAEFPSADNFLGRGPPPTHVPQPPSAQDAYLEAEYEERGPGTATTFHPFAATDAFFYDFIPGSSLQRQTGLSISEPGEAWESLASDGKSWEAPVDSDNLLVFSIDERIPDSGSFSANPDVVLNTSSLNRSELWSLWWWGSKEMCLSRLGLLQGGAVLALLFFVSLVLFGFAQRWFLLRRLTEAGLHLKLRKSSFQP